MNNQYAQQQLRRAAPARSLSSLIRIDPKGSAVHDNTGRQGSTSSQRSSRGAVLIHWGRHEAAVFLGPALSILAALTVATACVGEGPYAMIQSHLITAEDNGPAGLSCTDLSTGGETGSGVGSVATQFWVREIQNTDGVQIIWGEGSTTLGNRDFPPEFFEDHRMERFLIEEPNGNKHSYMVWGADECAECPEQEFTPLPGDPWGCGTDGDVTSTMDGSGQSTADETGNEGAAQGKD